MMPRACTLLDMGSGAVQAVLLGQGTGGLEWLLFGLGAALTVGLLGVFAYVLTRKEQR